MGNNQNLPHHEELKPATPIKNNLQKKVARPLSLFDRFTVTYGSIGAVIVLLLWFYLSGTAILIGAEVSSEIEKASAGISGPGDRILPDDRI